MYEVRLSVGKAIHLFFQPVDALTHRTGARHVVSQRLFHYYEIFLNTVYLLTDLTLPLGVGLAVVKNGVSPTHGSGDRQYDYACPRYIQAKAMLLTNSIL